MLVCGVFGVGVGVGNEGYHHHGVYYCIHEGNTSRYLGRPEADYYHDIDS